jgi:hypothetical protein
VEIVVLKQAQKELRRCPKEFAEDIYSLFEDLSNGKARNANFQITCKYCTWIK